MRRIIQLVALVVTAGCALATQTEAQTFNSGSTGALGALNVTSGTVTLTTPLDGVFNYTTINVSGGATLKFTRNAANTPITLLASGTVTINNATIDVSGAAGGSAGFSQTFVAPNGGAGGPGGFDGGSGANGIVSTTGGTGLGPGGGGGSTVTSGAGSQQGAGGGGFDVAGTAGAGGTQGTAGTGGASYGAPTLLPLIGGSGGGGGGAIFGNTGGGGGGGGGAIIIASSGTITLTGGGARILAQGGAGASSNGNAGTGSGAGGSGGAVRLIATTITSSQSPQITVTAGAAGVFAGAGAPGRVRVEAYGNSLGANYGSVPPSAVSSGQPTTVALTSSPTLRITSIAGVATPASPTGSFAAPDVTLPAGTANPVTVAIAGANIPLGTVVTVTVSGVNDGNASGSGALSGTVASSTASAGVTIPTTQPSVISASATFVVASLGGGPVYAEGEEVDRVRVSAALGGASYVSYITKSGREVVLGAR